MSTRINSLLRQVRENLELNISTDDVRALAREYERVVQERDEWKLKHDDLASRAALRDAVEKEDDAAAS